MKTSNNVHLSNMKVDVSMILDKCSDIVFLISSEGTIISINKSAEQYYRLKTKNYINKNFELLPENVKEQILPFIKKCSQLGKTGDTYDTCLKNSKKDAIKWNMVCLNAETGRPQLFAIIGKIDSIGNNVGMPPNYLEYISSIMPGNFYWKDKKGHYLGCNKALLKMLDLNSPMKLIGKTDFDLWPNQAEEVRKHDKKVMTTGKSIYVEEEVYIPHTGKMYFIVIKIPLLDAKGNIIGVIGNSLDISVLKAEKEDAERKSKMTAQYLQDIVSSVPGSIYWKDRNGVYLGCNEFMVKTAGMGSIKNIIGKTDYELWPEQAPSLRENDIQVMESGKSVGIEESVVLSNGKKRYFAVVKMPLRDINSNIIGVIGNSLEITELKYMQEDLKEAKELAEGASQAKSKFIANMSHDIRTPLAGMLGMAEAVMDNTHEAQTKEYAGYLISANHRLLGLLNDILEMSRLDLGHLPEKRSIINLEQVTKELKDLFLPVVINKGLKFKVEYDSNIPSHLHGNLILLHRALLNLLSNAIKFTSKGAVKLSVKQVKRNSNKVVIKFIISDTGMGIAQDQLKNIFEPFTRVIASHHGIHKGAGLGLHIVKQFVENLEGTIKVKSVINKGSVFTIFIPFIIADDPSPESDELSALIDESFYKQKITNDISSSQGKDSSSKLKNQKFHVLLVEDDMLAGKVSKMTLEHLECSVDLVTSGETAINKIKNNDYQLVYMDVGLPDKSGYEVTKEVRVWEDSIGKHTPIVALTAHLSKDNEQQCLDAGMDAVFIKPLSKSLAAQILQKFALKNVQKSSNKDVIADDGSDQDSDKVIDLELGARLVNGSLDSAREMLQMLVNSLNKDMVEVENAHKKEDWATIQQLIHKIRGGVSYCGTPRLKKACVNLEKYLNQGKVKLRNKLYKEFLNEVEAVRKAFTKS